MKQYSKFNIVAYNIWHIKSLCDYVKSIGGYYAYIKHVPEDEEKKLHYHLIIILNKGQRITFNKIVKVANSNNNFITDDNLEFTENLVNKLVNVPLSIQYLIHLNELDKRKYIIDDIITNDYDFTKSQLDIKFSYKDKNNITNDCLNDLYDIASYGGISSDKAVIEYLRSVNQLSLYSKNKYLINQLIRISKENE